MKTIHDRQLHHFCPGPPVEFYLEFYRNDFQTATTYGNCITFVPGPVEFYLEFYGTTFKLQPAIARYCDVTELLIKKLIIGNLDTTVILTTTITVHHIDTKHRHD